jgi:hypothetical protein
VLKVLFKSPLFFTFDFNRTFGADLIKIGIIIGTNFFWRRIEFRELRQTHGFNSKEVSMKWIKAVIGAALIGVAMGVSGCYTVIMVPQSVETYDNDRWSRQEQESIADSTVEKQDNGQVVNNFYIYDDGPGHWSFDPFWNSPYHWRYSSWWGGAFCDPWYDPWPYYGYYGSYGWSPFNRYGYVDWYAPGYYDPYWVYMDGNYGRDRGDKRRPFDRREFEHKRGELGGSGFSAASGAAMGGISRVGKASGNATDLGLGTRRIRRTAAEGAAKSSSGSGVSASSSDRRVRRTDAAGSGMKTAKGSSGAAPATTRSGGSERRERRSSTTSSSGSSPSHSGSSGSSSSGGSWGGSSSGSSGSSGRSSSPPSSGGGGGRPARR